MEIIRDVELIALMDNTGLGPLVGWFEARGGKVIKAIDARDPEIKFSHNGRPFTTSRGKNCFVSMKPTHALTANLICYPRSRNHEVTFIVEVRDKHRQKPGKTADTKITSKKTVNRKPARKRS